MDNCLKTLRQELLSMREAGDGLQTEMNSMMGALQELKLLKMQTALEQLQISSKTGLHYEHSSYSSSDATQTIPYDHKGISKEIKQKNTNMLKMPKNCTVTRESPLSEQEMDPSMFVTSSPFEKHSVISNVPRRHQPKGTYHRGSLCNSASFSSSEDDSISSYDSQGSSRLSDTPNLSLSGPLFENHRSTLHPTKMTNLQGLMDTLSREGPSIDSDFSQYDVDDSGDWTSSLMNDRRNRQPLVLGDNVLADLVGNWLDLPELESRTSDVDENQGRISESPQHPLRLSCSQEFCRRLSLTTSIFKKVLRSVRPDREKLLKERPGWQEDEEDKTLFKRAKKKSNGSTTKGSFYKPFWTKTGGKGKGRPKQDNSEEIRSSKAPLFDYSSAVWV